MSNSPIIENIKKIALKIDESLILFDGYLPKEYMSDDCTHMFWTNIVNWYGVFADCDNFQIKVKNSMFDLLERWRLISKDEKKEVLFFWSDISLLRKWFCHNNNQNLYYPMKQKQRLDDSIRHIFHLQTNGPNCIEELELDDWKYLLFYFESRFDNYLQILESALLKWENTSDKDKILSEWKEIYSQALYSNKELLSNVLAQKAQYYKIENSVRASVESISKRFEIQLKSFNYSNKQIESVMNEDLGFSSAEEIIFESLEEFEFEY